MTTELIPGIVRQSGDIFVPGHPDTSTEYEKLPTGTYLVDLSPMGFFCKLIPDMVLPKKLYGSTISRTARIGNTFLDRPGTTGVLLSGLKGSGKSLLAKSISIAMLDEDIPTLIVNKPFTGDMFGQFLAALNTPLVVLLDEFEKVFDAEHQEKMLTMLDGTYSKKILWLLTCNRQHKVDDNMLNRPSRIYYNIHYKGMEPDAVRELAKDTLNDKKRVDDIMKLSRLFNDEMNFDMVQSAIEELNRYPQLKANELMDMMNLAPPASGYREEFTAVIEHDGKTWSNEHLWPNKPSMSVFNFTDMAFYIRDEFSNEDVKAGTIPEVARMRPVGNGDDDLDDAIAETISATTKARRKKAPKMRAATDYEIRYDHNRLALGKDYDRIWNHWVSNFTYADQDDERTQKLTELKFSNRDMKGSNSVKGSYTFENSEGAKLTLTRVKEEVFGAKEQYERL